MLAFARHTTVEEVVRKRRLANMNVDAYRTLQAGEVDAVADEQYAIIFSPRATAGCEWR